MTRELEKAIETIAEGGQALGVSCEDVYERMYSDKRLTLSLIESAHSGVDVSAILESHIKVICKSMLLEALRAKMENDNDL
jgi:hypothetical protein